MVAMPVYGKNPLKILFSGPLKAENLETWVCSIGDSVSSRFIQTVPIVWHWPILNMKC